MVAFLVPTFCAQIAFKFRKRYPNQQSSLEAVPLMSAGKLEGDMTFRTL